MCKSLNEGYADFGADPHAQGDGPMNFNAYLGLDVHKETIAIAIADGRTNDVRFYGGISNTPDALPRR